MGDFASCVAAAVEAKAIPKKLGKQILDAADSEAEFNSIMDTLAHNKQRKMRDAVALRARLDDVLAENLKGEVNAGVGLNAILSRSEISDAINVDKYAAAVAATYHGRNNGMLSRFRTRMLGFSQDKEGLNDLVRALSGQKVKDGEIQAYAKFLSETFEELRLRFNKAGGRIGKNDKWFLPQAHDRRAIVDRKDEWVADVMGWADRAAMKGDNGEVLTDAELKAAFEYMHESIVTDGMNKTAVLAPAKTRGKLANRHAEQRFLWFKDADAWLAYSDKYGKSDTYTTITGHIDSLSHEIALMEMFGGNPEHTYKALRQEAKRAGASPERLTQADTVWNVVSGKVNGGELLKMADYAQTSSNVITASFLGGAMLSAVPDTAFSAMTSIYRGMPPMAALGRQMSMLNPANEADRMFAARMGLGVEEMINLAHAGNRWSEVHGTGVSAKAAEAVMRGSGLSAWTAMGRKGFGWEYNSMVSGSVKKSFDNLDPKLKKAFKEYGIDANQWDKIRSTEMLKHNDATYLDLTHPDNINLQMMILSEMDLAVPTPDARVRGVTTAGLGRATVSGQVWRTPMMLKSFPITLLFTHVSRAMAQSTMAGKFAYGGAMLALTTMLGGVALQLKDIAAGRTPRNMDKDGNMMVDSDFFIAAMAQGGGLGIFGDFLFADQNRFGQSLGETLAGPRVGLLDDVALDTVVGNIQKIAKGEETTITGDVVALANKYQPKIWQTRRLQQSAFEAMEVWVDDSAASRFNRRVRKREKEFDQDYWWEPAQLPEFLQ